MLCKGFVINFFFLLLLIHWFFSFFFEFTLKMRLLLCHIWLVILIHLTVSQNIMKKKKMMKLWRSVDVISKCITDTPYWFRRSFFSSFSFSPSKWILLLQNAKCIASESMRAKNIFLFFASHFCKQAIVKNIGATGPPKLMIFTMYNIVGYRQRFSSKCGKVLLKICFELINQLLLMLNQFLYSKRQFGVIIQCSNNNFIQKHLLFSIKFTIYNQVF